MMSFPADLKTIKRLYAIVKTGFDSMMPPTEIDRTRFMHVPVSIGDHLAAIDAMFERADAAGVECWIPPEAV